MNNYLKLQEPFAFWLVQQFLPTMDKQEEDAQPISDREFYTYISMVGGALALFGIILHAF